MFESSTEEFCAIIGDALKVSMSNISITEKTLVKDMMLTPI
jgi:hypothetical protein